MTGALASMRVLDMTQYEAGTSCTQALAFLGADVVKVEQPEVGDPGRGRTRGTDNRPYFLNWNANKRSLAIALDTPEGRDLLLGLLPKFDVFVENYGPGVLEKLDLGYEVMRRHHPRIIYARLKGFGLSGPYAHYKSYDMVAQAAGGAFSVTGFEGGPPTRPGYTVGDSGTGMQLALAITAAFVHRLQTGEGQEIEISMQEAVTYYMRTVVAGGSDFGRQAAPRGGNRAGPTVDLFPCAGGGPNDYVYVMATTPRMWDALAGAIGRPELREDPRFATGEARTEHADALGAEIAAWTSQRTKYEAMRVLGEAGVPASAVLDTRDLHQDPHLVARGFIQKVQHPTEGELTLLGWPPRLSKSDVPMAPAPLLGQHSAEVLAADLGLAAAEIERLTAAGVVGAAQVPAKA
ncbi:MAG: formyl-CoA transferase [Chloroflexi bacterium]|nr:formyl-CoA transferase [Chloroflexota bacterium]